MTEKQDRWVSLDDEVRPTSVWLKRQIGRPMKTLEDLWRDISKSVEIFKPEILPARVRCVTLSLGEDYYNPNRIKLEVELEERGADFRLHETPVDSVSMWGNGSSVNFSLATGGTDYEVRLLVKVHYKSKG